MNYLDLINFELNENMPMTNDIYARTYRGCYYNGGIYDLVVGGANQSIKGAINTLHNYGVNNNYGDLMCVFAQISNTQFAIYTSDDTDFILFSYYDSSSSYDNYVTDILHGNTTNLSSVSNSVTLNTIDYNVVGLIDNVYDQYPNAYSTYTEIYDEYYVPLANHQRGDGTSYYGFEGRLTCVYDYTNIESDTLFTTTDGYTFHTHCLIIELYDTSNVLGFNISLGDYGLATQQAYSDGYSAGNSAGYTSGFSAGYSEGFHDGYQQLPTADAFDYIESAFGAVEGIMSLEVLPHVTLGLAFSIPLVLILIMTIFKLVKK